MYLNAILLRVIVPEHKRLTVTLDVFKCKEKRKTINEKIRLTVTLDVFKCFVLFLISFFCFWLTVTLDVFKYTQIEIFWNYLLD